jgi:hypothetical protein
VKLFAPFGQVLALDPITAEYLDFRVARVRVGLCDDRHVPSLMWLMYCDQSGFWSRYDISLEIEQVGPMMPPPHPPRTGGSEGSGSGGSNGSGSGRGRWNDQGAGSSHASQPLAKKIATGSDKEKNNSRRGCFRRGDG